ncbi:CheR family methyltransferase [Candidatus Haliotispira prima]|uniref:CheR family methyltransferase n=1 Tax=Candidatus Haliotispira prima TaxID=3034016 RepID=A0ABY8MGQ5_9SPIO|nr:CheR family methyltransferase [Candidatus Haliotispira prima]
MSEVPVQNTEATGLPGDETDLVTVVEDFRMVTFSLGRKAYGIDIMQVKEISSAQHFTYVPNTASYVRGVFNLRGEIIPVIDMRLFFNLDILGEGSELDITRNNEVPEDLIILTFNYINIGIIVDDISHVVSIEHSMIQRSHPLFSKLDVPYIDGIVDYRDQLYIILAMDRIIDPHLEAGESLNFDLAAMFTNIINIPGSGPRKETSEETSGAFSTPLLGGPPSHRKPQDRLLQGHSEVHSEADSTNLRFIEAPDSASETVQETPVQEDGAHCTETQNTTEEQNRDTVPSPLPFTLSDSPLIDPIFSALSQEENGDSDVLATFDSPSETNNAEPSGWSDIRQMLNQQLAKEGFMVTLSNVALVEQKWFSWRHKKNMDIPAQDLLDSLHNRKKFIDLLQSVDYNNYWSENLQQAIGRHFRNHSGNLNVWHPGCGTGKETYSLAASLLDAAPEANLQVRAADSNLLKVAEAPLQSVGIPAKLPEWLRRYLNTEPGSEGYTFAKTLKDCIIFEYQDVIHATPHTKADLIVIRDLLPWYSKQDQDYILTTISHSLKTEGLIVVGDNESMDLETWEPVESEPLKMYRKKLKEETR